MAAAEVFANQAQTTVTTGGTTAPAQGTSEMWTVASSAAFPAASSGVSQFHVCDPGAQTEIILVSVTSGTTWTVTRGAEGTTPVAHSPGFTVFADLTAGTLGAFLQSSQAGTGYLVPNGSGAALTGITAAQVGAASTGALTAEVSRAEAAEALLAPLASPALTGSPTAPTQTTGDSSTKIATDAFVATAVAAETTRAETAEALLVPLSQKGANSGVATLDSGGHVPAGQLALAQLLSAYAAAGDLLYGTGAGASGKLAGNTSAVQALLAQTGTGSASAAPVWMYPAAVTLPQPTGVAATDTAAIQNAENALNALGGGALLFQPGTYVVNGLTKKSSVTWQGAGDDITVLKLANGANSDVVQGSGFSSLTLSGNNSGGIGEWAIRDMTIDGNKANNSSGYGLRFYGYDFDVYNLHIRNCANDGMYSEWGNYGSVTDSMESRVFGLKIHDCAGYGWHHRGPHDSHVDSMIIYSSGIGNFLAETAQTATVAAGSNGVNVSTFAGSGTLNVSSTLCFPSASVSSAQGSLTVVTSGGSGTAVITYTGVTATAFTGCTLVSGSGTLATGASVTQTGGGYSANATLISHFHSWGTSMTAAGIQVDGGFCVFTACVSEGCTQQQVLFRGNDSQWLGGNIFNLNSQGSGIQLGDSVNAAADCRVDAKTSYFAGSGTSTAHVYVANSGGNNKISLVAYAASGTALWGTLNYASRDLAEIQLNGTGGIQRYGRQQFITDTGSSAEFVVNDGTYDRLNYNATSTRWDITGGALLKFWSGSYTGGNVTIDGSRGHVISGGGTPGVSAGAQASGTPTFGSGSNDFAGEINAVALSSGNAAGTVAVVTYANAYSGNTPRVQVTPQTAAAQAAGLYVSAKTTSGFTVSCANAPGASSTMTFDYLVIG